MNTAATFLLLGSFALLVLTKMPIAFSLGISSIITAYYLNIPMAMIAQAMVRGINPFHFLQYHSSLWLGRLWVREESQGISLIFQIYLWDIYVEAWPWLIY